MTSEGLIRRIGALWLALCLPLSVAGADDPSADEVLARAIVLYEQQDYEQAQRELRSVDEDLLPEADKDRFTLYVQLVDIAVSQKLRAQGHLQQAEKAIADSQFDAAKGPLTRVLHNDFATSEMRNEARGLLAEVAKRERQHLRLASSNNNALPAQDANSQEADKLIRQGMEAMERGDYQDAHDLFQAALGSVPGHPDAVSGLEQVNLHLRVEAAPRSGGVRLIDQMRHKRQILWERAVSIYRKAGRDIQDLVSLNRYHEAKQMLQFARETIESARQYAEPLSKYEALKAEYAVLADMVHAREREYNEQRAFDLRKELEQKEELRLEKQEEERQRQVDLLMEQAAQKEDDKDYEGAIKVLRQVLVIDPNNAQAKWWMEKLRDVASVVKQVEDVRTRERETRKMLIDAEESKIPWHKELNYPDNWLEIIRSPYRRVPGQFPLDDESAEFEESFQSRIPEISFNQAPLGNVFGELADAGDINIVPNWPDLSIAGVTKDTKVSLKLKDVPVRVALAEVLDQVEGASTSSVGYNVSPAGIVKVATEDFLDREVFVRVYDVKDLIHPFQRFDDAPDFDLRGATLARRNMRMRENSRKMAPHNANWEDPREKTSEEFFTEEMDDLVKVIREHVTPSAWRSQGGPHSTIHARNDGSLVVSQTAAGHQQIFNLLNQLREDNSVQIAIEARFLTVSSHFLEDFGIDLDIILNNGNAGFDHIGSINEGFAIDPATGGTLLLPRNFTRLGFTPSQPGFGTATTQNLTPVPQPFQNVAFVPQNDGSGNLWSPIPVQNNATLYQPDVSDVPGSFSGSGLPAALQIAGSFLDNIQVDFLIRATQADKRNSTLIAPKLVLTNGQQAWIAVTEDQNFVSELEPVVASGAAAQRPIIDTVPTGAVLDVQATASPDRRYVTMNLQPGVGRLIAINEFRFADSPTVGVGAAGSIQEPIVQRQQVKTTVTVPDGGTLMIGGQKLTFESEVEAGVPVLSKIPLLKRLYSNRGTVKDEQVLLILIKPQILIQEEQEELAHPTLGSAFN